MQWARWLGRAGAVLVTWVTATMVVAAPGDALLVDGNNVNVRAGPSTDAGILARVGAGERATEMRRLGQWVEVAVPGQDVLGWIHGSLLVAAPQPAAETAAPTVQDGEPAARAAPVTVATVDPAATAAPTAAAPAAVQPRTGNQRAPGLPSGPAPTGPDTSAVAAAIPSAADAADSSPLGLFRSDVEHFNSRAVAAAGVDLFTGVAPLGEGGVQVITTDAWAIMSQPGQQSYLNALFGRWQAASGDAAGLRLEIVDSTGTLMMERSGP